MKHEPGQQSSTIPFQEISFQDFIYRLNIIFFTFHPEAEKLHQQIGDSRYYDKKFDVLDFNANTNDYFLCKNHNIMILGFSDNIMLDFKTDKITNNSWLLGKAYQVGGSTGGGIGAESEDYTENPKNIKSTNYFLEWFLSVVDQDFPLRLWKELQDSKIRTHCRVNEYYGNAREYLIDAIDVLQIYDILKDRKDFSQNFDSLYQKALVELQSRNYIQPVKKAIAKEKLLTDFQLNIKASSDYDNFDYQGGIVETLLSFDKFINNTFMTNFDELDSDQIRYSDRNRPFWTTQDYNNPFSYQEFVSVPFKLESVTLKKNDEEFAVPDSLMIFIQDILDKNIRELHRYLEGNLLSVVEDIIGIESKNNLKI